mmetsp:Transcript_18262/g.40330  ORF Transcript_18262/g.40330 Transcript_18262/m.40330 type:complete len:215 (-) Transcript_18262:53-697(-)
MSPPESDGPQELEMQASENMEEVALQQDSGSPMAPMLPTPNDRRIGNIRIVRVGRRTYYVGPHWLCSILMVMLISAIGGTYTVRIAPRLGVGHVIAGAAVTGLALVAFLRCAVANPGVVGTGPRNAPEGRPQMLVSRGHDTCRICDVSQPSGTMHCEFCNVCIEGWDHHCPWTSKCVGGANMGKFKAFVAIDTICLMFVSVMAVFGQDEILNGS